MFISIFALLVYFATARYESSCKNIDSSQVVLLILWAKIFYASLNVANLLPYFVAKSYVSCHVKRPVLSNS